MNAFLERIEAKVEQGQRLTLNERAKLNAMAYPCPNNRDLSTQELVELAKKNLSHDRR